MINPLANFGLEERDPAQVSHQAFIAFDLE